ncbi:hypothetical protein AX16_004547 [Volvariella volvacea WC 439]|nr:hypothetical protein AX16_004547 [Volvariella volvacea WC 439]
MQLLRSPLRTVPNGLLRLSASFVELFPQGDVDFNHWALRDLTHLDVLDDGIAMRIRWNGNNGYSKTFGCLKSLKHLAFHNHIFAQVPMGLIRNCLGECEGLEVLVIARVRRKARFFERLPKVRRRLRRSPGVQRLGGRETAALEEVPEDRVVTNIQIGNRRQYWFRGAEGGLDFWERAELVVKRRRGPIAAPTLWNAEIDLGEWFDIVEFQLGNILTDQY